MFKFGRIDLGKRKRAGGGPNRTMKKCSKLGGKVFGERGGGEFGGRVRNFEKKM